jgi:DNA-binding LacI/PurR family transcriptional regulator
VDGHEGFRDAVVNQVSSPPLACVPQPVRESWNITDNALARSLRGELHATTAIRWGWAISSTATTTPGLGSS